MGKPRFGASASKYGAKRTEYNGRTYASKIEAAYAAQLDLAERAGVVAFWLPQPLVILGPIPYRPDFIVAEWASPGHPTLTRVHFVDVKGAETQRFRDVKRMWAEFGPAPLRVVKRGKLAETIEGRVRA